MRSVHSLLALGALAAFGAGCATHQPEEGLATQETAVVRVENDNVINMRISVLRAPSGAVYRLGTAPGAQVTTLQIPRSLLTGVNELTFEITPLSGGTRRFTRTMTVSPGDEIVLRIPPIL